MPELGVIVNFGVMSTKLPPWILENEKIAKIYKYNFPNDNIIVTDAHEYLLNHFKEFDFIWSSPPLSDT